MGSYARHTAVRAHRPAFREGEAHTRQPHGPHRALPRWRETARHTDPGNAEVLTDEQDLELVQKLLLDQYKFSYRVVMLIYRIGRRLRGKKSIADGAALAITLDTDSQ